MSLTPSNDSLFCARVTNLNISRGLNKCIDHLLANWPIYDVAFKHRKQHDHHFLLKIHEFAQKIQLIRVFAQLFLHVSKDVQKTADGIPQSTVRQSELVADTRTLDVLCEGAEHLFANFNSSNEILLASVINGFFAGVMPIEVHDGFLEAKQIVHTADNDVHGCRIASLRTQVVLEG